MLNTVLRQIAEPLSRRVGTYIAGMLSAFSVSAEHVHAIELGVVAMMTVLFDLALSNMNKANR